MIEQKNNNFQMIIDLFRKTIASLVCIEKFTDNNYLKQTTEEYLIDIISQYASYYSHKDVNKITFKYSEKQIVDFCNECYEEINIMEFAEDLEYGFTKLVEKILEERNDKNG